MSRYRVEKCEDGWYLKGPFRTTDPLPMFTSEKEANGSAVIANRAFEQGQACVQYQLREILGLE